MLIGIDASRAVAARRTGTESYAVFLIRALIELASDGSHAFRLYFNQPPEPGLFPEASHVEQQVMPFPRLWTHFRLARELKRRPPDIFFTPAHVIPFTYRGCSVATVHDLGYVHFPEAHARGQRAYLRLTTRTNGRLSKRVIADSTVTKQDLIQFYKLDAAKIDIVYPGVDPQLARVQDEARIHETCQKYGIEAPYLLYLGTLQPRKNLVRLVRAFIETDLPHQLVIAGKGGWLAEPILREVESLPLSMRRRVSLPGYIPEVDKAAIISGATAMLYPSLYEGFGFPVLEAQACGTAVLTGDNSSLPEVAGAGALLVDAQDQGALTNAMMRLATDSELRAELVSYGRENVRRFTWRDTAIQVLRSLTAAKQNC